MPKFFYIARSSEGDKQTGYVDADNQQMALRQLRSQDFIVSKLTPVKAKLLHKKETKFTHGRVTDGDMVFFARQMATMMDAGVSILKSLEMISLQASSKNLYLTLKSISEDVEGGSSLGEAIAKHPKIFDSLWVNLIETGEASGSLPIVLERLAHYLEVRSEFRRNVISAMIYPSLLVLAAAGAILVFVFKIIPTFTGLFEQFDVELPALTKGLLAVTNFLRSKWWVIILGFFALIVTYVSAYKTPIGRRRIDSAKLSLPALKGFLSKLYIERFTSEMATLLESGVPIVYALDIAQKSAENVLVRDAFATIKDDVKHGKPLSEPMEETNMFPPVVIQMIKVGEETGRLPQMFKRLGDFYQREVETLIQRLVTFIEPAMIIIMGAIIGTMVIAMFLPIFKLSQVGM